MSTVGEIRPSQLMFTFGVGATMDLPNMSVLVMGLDNWNKDLCALIRESRLLTALQLRVGNQLKELRLPPVNTPEIQNDALGIPVVPFPRWMRCRACGLLAPLEDGLFEKNETPYEPTRFVHTHCPKANPKSKSKPSAIPVRFLLACANGHLSDVPWNDFVHDGHPCDSPHLIMSEFGITGDVTSISIKCENCNKRKMLSELVSQLRKEQSPYRCSGLHPHLRFKDTTCAEKPHLLTLGASNLWFSQTLSVLSLPEDGSELLEYIRQNWDSLSNIDNPAVIEYISQPREKHAALHKYTTSEVLQTIKKEKERQEEHKNSEEEDIKLPEWKLFSSNTSINSSQLEIQPRDAAPIGFEDFFEPCLLVPHLSEVRAMYGFTRLNTQQELDLGIINNQKAAPLTHEPPTWLPAYESHGEGFFIRFKESKLKEWEHQEEVIRHNTKFLEAHRAWRKSRKLQNIDEGYPGIRFVLLHSFAHALMQQIALDCGYTAASIRERLYCRTDSMPGGPMAGILLYTAAADSEGTLGGLVSQGEPASLGHSIAHALENMRLCTSDPLCAEHLPEADGRNIHGAACHACLFSPETACECGNRYLDRNVLINTFNHSNIELAFWKDYHE